MQDQATPFEEKPNLFWLWFADNKESLASIKANSDPILGIALEKLRSINEGLFLEVASNCTPKEFVITAAGKTELFPLVDILVASAPPVMGWRFVSLKPKMGFDFNTEYRGYTYDPKEMWFLPLIKRSDSSYLGLRIGLKYPPPQDKKEIYNAVTIVLETGLGEREFAREIKYVEVAPLPSDPAKEGFIELFDLAKYIGWRKRNPANSES